MVDQTDICRTVVTGQGMVTPLGRTPAEIWERWAAGTSAIKAVNRSELEFYGVKWAAEVSDFQPRKEIRNRKLLRLMIDGEPFGYVAVTKAFEDARLTPDDYPGERAGVAIGCHKEGFRDENLYDALDIAVRDDGSLNRELLIEDGIRRIPPQTLVEGLANAALYYFAHEFGLQGVNHNFISSGTGGMLAIGEAMRSVRRGEADVMLAGSYDTWLSWECVAHQTYTHVLSHADGAAEAIQKSFDENRCGAAPGEGAGMLILEDRTHAVGRGATIHGELCGFSLGTGIIRDDRDAHAERYAGVIRRAIENAGCQPEDIDLVHLQGEATPEGDWIEAKAVEHALGAHAAVVPATTIRSTTGSLGNASGPVEIIMTLEMLRRGEVLPITNLETPDPEFRLNFVREPLKNRPMQRALLLQRSWPCHVTALVVGRTDD